MYEGILLNIKTVMAKFFCFFLLNEQADIMLFLYSYEAALISVNFQFIFNIIPDISSLKMCRGALFQLAAPICTPEMLYCTDTFMEFSFFSETQNSVMDQIV